MKNNKLFITLITLSLSLFLYNYSLSQNVINNDTIYTVVDNSPEYPRGMDSLIKFLNINVHYPTIASDKEIQGSVYVTFIVNKDGSINNPTILRGIGGGCDEEAIRVIKLT